jgi:hypothetical protein
MTLEFKGDHKVELTMQESGGEADTKEADYLLKGNEVTIQVPGGLPLVLVRDGKTLSANLFGQVLHFAKR